MLVNRRRVISLVVLLTILLMLGAGLHHVKALIALGVAYKAKILCSGVFIAGRSPESLLNEDLAVDDLAVLRHIDVIVDQDASRVTSDFLGVIEQVAIYRPGFGCTLVYDGHGSRQAANINDFRYPETELQIESSLPRDSGLSDRPLEAVLDWAFSETDPEHARRTRAIVILHRGRVIAERYAPGFDRHTPLIGWSMTKSVMHAVVGILVGQGRLSIHDRIHAPEWQSASNGRDGITLKEALINS